MNLKPISIMTTNIKNCMKNKIATTVEQSKKLLELGLSTDTADMYWEYDSFQAFHRLELFEDEFPKNLNKNDIPA